MQGGFHWRGGVKWIWKIKKSKIKLFALKRDKQYTRDFGNESDWSSIRADTLRAVVQRVSANWCFKSKYLFFRAAFKFGRRVHCALWREMRKPSNTCVPAIKESPKLKDGQHLRRNSQVTIDTATNEFNSGQFKIRMKKMAAQVNFYLYTNAFLSSELLGAWKLAHVCQIKALLTYLRQLHRW